MAIKRYLRNKKVEIIKVTPTEDKDARIRRLEALLKDLTYELAQVTGYTQEVAPAESYPMYC